ncbi:MAG: aldose epimerase family protein [Ginsengibacter sp.]
MLTNKKNPFLSSEFYGIIEGQEVYKYTLQNESIKVDITNLGCSIMAIYTKGSGQREKNIVAGFKDIKDYENNPYYFGCVIGRYANRITNGKFTLDSKNIQLSVNDGINHLHGGFEGFNKKVWKLSNTESDEDKIRVEFEYLSRDGEEGYHGNLMVKVKYILNSKNQLCIEYNAGTDKATPVSLTNHSYFNLSGFESPNIYEHLLYVNAENYTEKNLNNTPTGDIIPVADTPLDFRLPKKIGKEIHQFPKDKGFDHNFILKRNFSDKIVTAAKLKDPSSGRTVTVYTDQPGIQVYTANFWDGTVEGSHGVYQQHGAVALETQAFPDSPNHPAFPDTILRPGQDYFSTTIYEFGIE